ncbi:MAG: 3'-5' exonuclease, partial [Candidatus Peribacteraceae bacterium]
MKLPAIPLVVLDTETTGLVPRVNRVIEFAAVRIENGKTVAQYEQLFSIPTEIPETVQVLTRIRPSDLKDQPTLEEKRDEILKIIGDDAIIVGQNVGFDIRMLRGEGIDLSQHPWIDTSMVASLVFPELLSYSLGYVSTVLNLKHEPVHRAMGDVNATLELLSRCWERFLELPHELYEVAQTIMEKSAPGYQRLFQALPQPTATSTPHWLSLPGSAPVPPVHDSQLSNAVFHKPEQGTLSLVEEPLNPTTLQQLLTATTKDPHTVHWIAVKNLDATLRRIAIPDGVCVLSPPEHLLDLDAAALFAAQKSFTADEGTLALKMAWFEPETQCSVRLHGEEYSIWNGKLACTDRSPAYRDQFNDPPSVLLLDHRQLLQFLADPEHCAHGALDERAHIIIDDASMLEDTATKAYGWFCNLDHLRAGAEGD